MDEFTNRIVGKIDVSDALAVAKNIATNGRLFMVMLFILNIVAFASHAGPGHLRLAFVCAVVVGLTHVGEMVAQFDMRAGRWLVYASITTAIAVSVVTVISI